MSSRNIPTELTFYFMPVRLDGSGTTRVRVQKATGDFFEFDSLPVPSINNPAQDDFTGGVWPWPIRNKSVAVRRFRIAYEEWPGHGKPRMASVGVLGPWKQESFEVIHRHLVEREVPYLYLANEFGNPLSDSWVAPPQT